MQENKIEHNTNFHHIVPIRVYMTVFIALSILTIITVIVAYVNLGIWNVPVALAIATLKATLVILYFMHVRYSGKLIHFCIISGVLFFILLIFGVMQDYWSRENVRPVPRENERLEDTVLPGTPQLGSKEHGNTEDKQGSTQILAH